VLSELAPFVVLAEKLWCLAIQLVADGGGIKSVKVTYASARAPDDLDTRLLRSMITKGLIEPIASVFVNLVNADFTTKQRGVRITEERIMLDGSPETLLITLSSDRQCRVQISQCGDRRDYRRGEGEDGV
jgi:D-3-phosphoglycerate dehydrogenase